MVSGTVRLAWACPVTRLPVFHKTAARKTIPNPKPRTNAATVFMPLLLQRGRRAGADDCRQFQHVPVRQPDTTVRGGMPDLARLRRTVNSVVIFGEVDPRQADRVVRARGERLLVG